MPCRLGWVCAVDDNLRTKVARVSALCCYSYSDAAGFHVLTSAVHQFDWMQLCLESKATTLYSWCATVVIAGGEEAHIGRASESIPIIINELVWWIRASRGREDDLDKGNCCENRQQSEQRIPDLVILWQTFYCISSYDDDDDYIQGLYSRLWSNNKHWATAVWCQREAEEEGGWIVWYEGAMQTINLCIWYTYYSC